MVKLFSYFQVRINNQYPPRLLLYFGPSGSEYTYNKKWLLTQIASSQNISLLKEKVQ